MLLVASKVPSSIATDDLVHCTSLRTIIANLLSMLTPREQYRSTVRSAFYNLWWVKSAIEQTHWLVHFVSRAVIGQLIYCPGPSYKKTSQSKYSLNCLIKQSPVSNLALLR